MAAALYLRAAIFSGEGAVYQKPCAAQTELISGEIRKELLNM